MAELVRIKTFSYRHQAELFKGFLEKEGIKAIIVADDCGGHRPDLAFVRGGVGLCVSKDDEQKAKDVLKFFDD
jgi:hypothetical protein